MLRILVPGLFHSQPLPSSQYPALAMLSARGTAEEKTVRYAEQGLAQIFGWTDPAPVAALRRLGDEVDGVDESSNEWTCADPVHLSIHYQGVDVIWGSALQLSAAQADAFIATLQSHAPQLTRGQTPWQWYLPHCIPGANAPPNNPLHQDQQGSWKLWLHEVQMLLHEHPVNQQRKSHALPVVNSLWLWGSGALVKNTANPPLARLQATTMTARLSTLSRGLAQHANIPWQLITDAGEVGEGMVLIDEMMSMDQVEQRWLQPALKRLCRQDREMALIRLGETTMSTWRLTCAQRYRFWQRQKEVML